MGKIVNICSKKNQRETLTPDKRNTNKPRMGSIEQKNDIFKNLSQQTSQDDDQLQLPTSEQSPTAKRKERQVSIPRKDSVISIQKKFRSTQLSRRTEGISEDEDIDIDSFQYDKDENGLGQGAYGAVFWATRKSKMYAVKEISKNFVLKHDKIKAVYRERDLLQKVPDCPFIVALDMTLQDEDNLYFVMEYVDGGNLSKIIMSESRKEIPEAMKQFTIAEIILGLEYMHKNMICHRDLKPDNILYDSNFHVKICDFGEAKQFKPLDRKQIQLDFEDQAKKHKNFTYEKFVESFKEDEGDSLLSFEFNQKHQDQIDEMFDGLEDEDLDDDHDFKKTLFGKMARNESIVRDHRGTFVGTPLYVSPEMLNESSSGPFTDLWSLGVIIYEFMTGASPWLGKTREERFNNIKDANIPMMKYLDKKAADLIQKLLVVNPLERLGVGEEGTKLDFKSLKKHPYFKGINWQKLEKGQLKPPINADLVKKLRTGKNNQ